jgi:hypothetical protein
MICTVYNKGRRHRVCVSGNHKSSENTEEPESFARFWDDCEMCNVKYVRNLPTTVGFAFGSQGLYPFTNGLKSGLGKLGRIRFYWTGFYKHSYVPTLNKTFHTILIQYIAMHIWIWLYIIINIHRLKRMKLYNRMFTRSWRTVQTGIGTTRPNYNCRQSWR